MRSILGELAGLRRPEAAQALGRRLGGEADASARALAAALPTLLSALARSGARSEAVRLLAEALEREPDEGFPADVPGALGTAPPAWVEAILDLALGTRRAVVEVQIARRAGLEPIQAGTVLAGATMLVLAALHRASRQEGCDAVGLARRLAAERMLAEDAVPGSVGIFEELLEADADTDLGDDVTEVGAQLLARLCTS